MYGRKTAGEGLWGVRNAALRPKKSRLRDLVQ
jgi:hypothetical protein